MSPEDLFPKNEYYPFQRDTIDVIYRYLSENRIVLFEGGCGTGKTLTALVPALSLAVDSGLKVVIATDVHRQMDRFIEEGKEIKRKNPDVTGVAIVGKTSMCPMHKSYTECEYINKREEKCPYTRKRDSLQPLTRWILEDIRYPSETVQKGMNENVCPYEIVRNAMKNSDFIVCNYRHIFDLDILYRFITWLDADLSEIILVLDEAHNIEAKARECASFRISVGEIKKSLQHLPPDSKEYGFISHLIQSIYEHIDMFSPLLGEQFFGVEKIPLRVDDSPLTDTLNEYESDIETFTDSFIESGNESLYLTARFLLAYLELSDSPYYYPQIIFDRAEKSGIELELYACLPERTTRPVFSSVHSSLLMSATLQPFHIIPRVLGIEREIKTINIPSPFPRENRMTLTVSFPPLFSKVRNSREIIYGLKDLLENIAEYSTGNVLIFFPSQDEAERYSRLLEVSMDKILDKPGRSLQALEEFRSKKHAVLFSYLWGTLSEGVDYPDDLGRVVVIVGVGYPALSGERQAIISAYETVHGEGMGWRYAVEIPTIRRIRQAMGRIIRSPRDYGVRVLIDFRYTKSSVSGMPKYSVYGEFPQEERQEFIEVSPEDVPFKIREFFKGKG